MLRASLKTLANIRSLREVLPSIVAVLTQHNRTLSDIEWSDKSWTHNVFRVYEMIFGRRFGIKKEMSSGLDAEGNQFYICHSWESCFALTETYIREFLASWRFVPVRIWIPIMRTPEGIPFLASPYVFAVALDTATDGGAQAASPKTFSHTVTGTNPIIVIGSQTTPSAATAASYNSVAASLAVTTTDSGSYIAGLWYKLACATGSNTVSISSAANNLTGGATSYSGVLGAPDATVNYTGTSGMSNPGTIAITSVADNCWAVCAHNGISASIPVASTGTTQRYQVSGGTLFGDSGSAKTPAGTISMSATYSDYPVAGRYALGCAMTISPTAIAASSIPNKIIGVFQAVKRASYY